MYFMLVFIYCIYENKYACTDFNLLMMANKLEHNLKLTRSKYEIAL